MWPDPDPMSHRQVLAPLSMRGATPGADLDPVTRFLTGLSRHGAAQGAPATAHAQRAASLGLARSQGTGIDAVLLRSYEGDPAMHTALLARIRADATPAGGTAIAEELTRAPVEDSVAVGEGATAVASETGALIGDGASPASSAWVENALAQVARLDPHERTAVLTDAARAAGSVAATAAGLDGDGLDLALETALRAAPPSAAQEALAVGLEQAVARRDAAVHVAPVHIPTSPSLPVDPHAVRPEVRSAANIAAAVTGTAPTADHAAQLVDLAAHGGSVEAGAAAVSALADHGEIGIATVAEAVRIGPRRLKTLDEMIGNALRMGPFVRHL